jgi:transcriptional regulator with XRE-family HTH domain
MLKRFTEELKEAREQAGITLQKIAAKTRIDIKFLEALEEGNFGFLPEIYVKAFIKQYAIVVGLDEEETLQKYNMAKEGGKIVVESKRSDNENVERESSKIQKSGTGDQPEIQTKSFEDVNEIKNESGTNKRQNPILIGATVFGVIVVSLLVYLLFINSGDDIIVEEKPYEEVLQDSPQRFIEENIDRTVEDDVASNYEELTLTITNVDSSDSAWVLVIIDDAIEEDFLLYSKLSKTVKANYNFKLILGNSGAVKLVLNNEELNFDGQKGAVRYFALDNNGLERLDYPPKISRE